MSIHSFSELGGLFANQSKDICERLGYVRDSYKSRGVLGPVRFGEETITDLLMMDLYVQRSTLAHFEQTSKLDEAMWGTDFELCLGWERKGWFRFSPNIVCRGHIGAETSPELYMQTFCDALSLISNGAIDWVSNWKAK